ncbi:hypothetical protein N7450_007651 [Penicillium hetheringtonii]|uniref:Uncharacterized protein n=1 Tax=Penicillium hetheringtonii TaxID=911720 RepID=A0AAD6GSU2_9EURO|nr:hypothetical protein N7450_007651 [Penicillium hetheringtonii]
MFLSRRHEFEVPSNVRVSEPCRQREAAMPSHDMQSGTCSPSLSNRFLGFIFLGIKSKERKVKLDYCILLPYRYNFNVRQKCSSALLWGVVHNQSKLVDKMLCKYQADTNTTGDESRTPIFHAIRAESVTE